MSGPPKKMMKEDPEVDLEDAEAERTIQSIDNRDVIAGLALMHEKLYGSDEYFREAVYAMNWKCKRSIFDKWKRNLFANGTNVVEF